MMTAEMDTVCWAAPGEESKPAAAERTGAAGKPELPQQEPAVAPGSTITIPESKNIAPEPKVEAPKPATKAAAPEAPAATPPPAAPALKPAGEDDPLAFLRECAQPPLPPQFTSSSHAAHVNTMCKAQNL